MSRGKTIRIYLIDGVPTGALLAEIINWTGRVLVFPRQQLSDVAKRDEIRRTGIYCLVGADPETAVICLLSALRFHELTTQNPFEVWIMIDRKARQPAIEHPPVRVIRASGAALKEGANFHRLEGVLVRVTHPAKTVADCFKYRSKVGTDVAIEALRDCWRQRKATMDEIHRYAKIDRVVNVMRPYMESLV